MEADYASLTEQQIQKITNKDSININIGILGHVDSGKTSICRVLSEITSTASLDKNPQSQERGITLDLGFSAFFTKIPSRFQISNNKKYFQFTLVDCPGHASLIKTVIGGAQIIDIMFLIIDINKGIQTQTAQCLAIGQLFIEKIIIILNKVDMIPSEQREQIIGKKIEALRKIFAKTKYGPNVIFTKFSTKQEDKIQYYIKKLQNTLLDTIQIPLRNEKGNLLLLIDHCFPIKGKGSVVTGTIIQGMVKAGDQIEFPLINDKRKVKSLQMFKKPVNSGIQGDRIALLFTQLETELIQRGLCCTPGYLSKMQNCIMDFNKIKYYKGSIKNKSKFHIISGHQTTMGQIRLFITYEQNNPNAFDFNKQYEAADSLQSIQQQSKINNKKPYIFALIKFQKQFYTTLKSTLVGYKFDGDLNQNICRLAFHGKVLQIIKKEEIQAGGILKIYKYKSKYGVIDKINDEHTLLVKDLFKKQVNINNFIGKQIQIQHTGNKGKIQCAFGNSGKVKVYFQNSILQYTVKSKDLSISSILQSKVIMNYKKYYLQKK